MRFNARYNRISIHEGASSKRKAIRSVALWYSTGTCGTIRFANFQRRSTCDSSSSVTNLMDWPGEEPVDVVTQLRERGIGDDAEDANADPGRHLRRRGRVGDDERACAQSPLPPFFGGVAEVQRIRVDIDRRQDRMGEMQEIGRVRDDCDQVILGGTHLVLQRLLRRARVNQ